MAPSLLLEVHNHLAAVIDPCNKPHLDNFPLHIFTVCNSTIYFYIILPSKTHHIERIPTSSTYTGISYCKDKKPSHISVLTLWQHTFTCFCMYEHSGLL